MLSIEIIHVSCGIQVEFLVPAVMRVGKVVRLIQKVFCEQLGLVMLQNETPLLFDPADKRTLPEDYTLVGAGIHNGSLLYFL